MRYRTYKNTDLRVSEVGFGLWTISTGWWGQFTEGEAIHLMHKAFDLGITLFDAADTYGNGLSEELIAKAFPKQRDEIVIATKVGYDFVTHGESRGRGQREIPQDFSPDAIVRATDAALKRLKTDRIDLLQLHNIRMDQIYDDALWTTVEKLKASGKIRYYGIALGPAIGWLYEGVNCIRERDISSVQHIYNMLEQHPGRAMHNAASEAGKDTMFLIRVTHSSGMLEGKYTAETTFPPGDHRSHRPRSWLLNGVKKVEQLRCLENAVRFYGAAARAAVGELSSRFVELLEHVRDHRRRSAAAMNRAANFSLIDCGKRILRLIGRQKSSEPGCGSLLVFRPPLRGPGFSGYFGSVQTGLMGSAAGSIHNVDHPGTDLLQGGR